MVRGAPELAPTVKLPEAGATFICPFENIGFAKNGFCDEPTGAAGVKFGEGSNLAWIKLRMVRDAPFLTAWLSIIR